LEPERGHAGAPRRAVALLGAALLATALAASLPAAGAGGRGRSHAIAAAASGPWSEPAPLQDCAASGAPAVVFPQSAPTVATGPGAVIWNAAAACPGGRGARLAAVGPTDVPGPPQVPRSAAGAALELGGALAAAAGPHGEVVIAGAAPRGQGDILIQGLATGPFSKLHGAALAPAQPALTSAYLGDVALAAPAGAGGGLLLEVERHFAHTLQSPIATGTPATAAVRALTVALDYRSDALLVWQQGGALYARALPASGPAHATERLAAVAGRVHVSALLSDDTRAIIAWSEQDAGRTRVYLERSAAQLRFGSRELLEELRDPAGSPAPAASPILVRLRSESVMLAWAGASGGHWVVRTAALDLRGEGAGATISSSGGGDALLAGLVPAPDGGALALWTEPQPPAVGSPAPTRQALLAARGIDSRPDTTRFGPPETVAPPGPWRDPAAAFDPASDRAVAVWKGAGGRLLYAIRNAAGAP